MNNDDQHLQYLFIGYLISGVFLGLLALFPVIHLVFGFSMVLGLFEGTGDAPPPAFGLMFIAIGGFLILMFLTWSILNFVTAFSLKSRKRYVLCLVTAGLNCTSMPFGTILGVFTFIVLFRDSVKPLFGR